MLSCESPRILIWPFIQPFKFILIAQIKACNFFTFTSYGVATSLLGNTNLEIIKSQFEKYAIEGEKDFAK
jgi:hypothetical protein